MAEVETISMETLSDLTKHARVAHDPSLASLYRGHRNAGWSLVPPLYRVREVPLMVLGWNYLEQDLLRRFRSRAAGAVNPRPIDDFEWLTLGRHHGLPTRLLDWTTSPLIALWFALQNIADGEPEDSCVWEIRTSATIFAAEGTTLKALDSRIKHGTARIYPPHISPRITAQSSVFTIHKNPDKSSAFSPLEQQVAGFGVPPTGTPFTLRKFVIPGEYRRRMKLELSALGVGPSTTMPDLDGIAADIVWQIEQASMMDPPHQTE